MKAFIRQFLRLSLATFFLPIAAFAGWTISPRQIRSNQYTLFEEGSGVTIGEYFGLTDGLINTLSGYDHAGYYAMNAMARVDSGNLTPAYPDGHGFMVARWILNTPGEYIDIAVSDDNQIRDVAGLWTYTPYEFESELGFIARDQTIVFQDLAETAEPGQERFAITKVRRWQSEWWGYGRFYSSVSTKVYYISPSGVVTQAPTVETDVSKQSVILNELGQWTIRTEVVLWEERYSRMIFYNDYLVGHIDVRPPNSPPSISWTSTYPGYQAPNVATTIGVNASDSNGNLAYLRIWMDAEPPTTAQASFSSVSTASHSRSFIPTTGAHTIYAQAIDSGGLTSNTISYSFYTPTFDPANPPYTNFQVNGSDLRDLLAPRTTSARATDTGIRFLHGGLWYDLSELFQPLGGPVPSTTNYQVNGVDLRSVFQGR